MIKRISLLVFFAAMLQACATAPQTAMPVDPQFWQQSQKRVAVVVDDVPGTTVATPGAGCLLCVAVARGIVGGLDKHFTTLQADDLNSLSGAIISTLRDQEVTAGKLRTPLVIDKLPKFKRSDIPSPSKDFRDFAEKK